MHQLHFSNVPLKIPYTLWISKVTLFKKNLMCIFVHMCVYVYVCEYMYVHKKRPEDILGSIPRKTIYLL